MPQNLTITGSGASFDTSVKKFGTASIKFDGSGSWTVSGGKVPASGAFSVGTWFRTTSNGNGVLVSQLGCFYILTSGGNVGAAYGNGGNEQSLSGNVTINDGAWHYVELDVGPGGGALYVDGTLASTNATTAAAAGCDRTTNPILLGSLFGPGFYFTGNIDDVAIYSTLNAGAKPSTALTGNETGLVNLYHLDGDGGDAVGTGAAVTIAANNPALLYSPGNWSGATSLDNRTINAGAYLKVLVNGACKINFDVSNNGTPLSKIAWRMNGGPWTDVVVAASIGVSIPAVSSVAPWNLLEVCVVSTSQGLNRWAAPSATAVVFTSITSTSSSFAVRAPARQPYSILLFGDSITEGVRVNGYQAANDTDDNDARQGWAWLLGDWLGGEFGIIGFGGQGWCTGGGGGVPALPSTFDLNFAGSPRTWPADLRAVIVNMGTNSGGATDAQTTAAIQQFLTGVLASTSASTASIVMMRPFNGAASTDIQAAIAAVGSQRVFYEDTAGIYDANMGSDDITLHPNGPNNRARIAPALMSKVGKYAQLRRFTVQVA